MVGSGGSTGAMGALAVMSAVSFTALATSAALIRTPPREYTEESLSHGQTNLFLSPLLTELTARESKSVAASDSRNGSGAVDDEVSEEVNFFTAMR